MQYSEQSWTTSQVRGDLQNFGAILIRKVDLVYLRASAYDADTIRATG